MFIDIVLDVLLVFFLLVGIFIGYRRGFVKSIAKPLRFFASVATAFLLSSTISNKLLEPRIKTPVTNQIKSYLLENCPSITPESASEELPTLLKFAASLLDFDLTTLSTEDTVSAIVDSLASPIVHIVSLIVTFILVYFIAKWLFSLLLTMISGFFGKGVISIPNRVLGCVTTCFFAMIAAWLFTIIFDFVIHSSIFAQSAWAADFEGGIIYKFFNKNSPVDILLSF